MEDSLAYKCPQCGAGLTFSASSHDFFCEYCGGHFTVDRLDKPLTDTSVEDYGQEETKTEDTKFNDENRLYLCPSCGAAVITDSELSASAECHYCHSPVVLSGRLSGEFRPDKIIPFSKTKEEAVANFHQWTDKRKFFLAKGFGSEESLNRIQGIYVPFWMADCSVEGSITADCYKTIGSHRSGDYIIKTEAHSVAVRQGSIVYKGVLADGSSKADDNLMDSIEPFNYDELVEFDMSYLSGHNAERYDVTKELVFPRIEKRVKDTTAQEFLKTITGYSRVNVNSSKFDINNIKWKYVLLPMWFLTFFYKDKLYYYAMNGQTGKFGGTLPINKGKLFLVSLGIGLLAALIISFLLLLGGVLE